MVPNDVKTRMALSFSKKLSALLHGITSKNEDGFYCLSCLCSFRTENKLRSNEKKHISVEL